MQPDELVNSLLNHNAVPFQAAVRAIPARLVEPALRAVAGLAGVAWESVVKCDTSASAAGPGAHKFVRYAALAVKSPASSGYVWAAVSHAARELGDAGQTKVRRELAKVLEPKAVKHPAPAAPAPAGKAAK